jgi:hypothetical protein
MGYGLKVRDGRYQHLTRDSCATGAARCPLLSPFHQHVPRLP